MVVPWSGNEMGVSPTDHCAIHLSYSIMTMRSPFKLSSLPSSTWWHFEHCFVQQQLAAIRCLQQYLTYKVLGSNPLETRILRFSVSFRFATGLVTGLSATLISPTMYPAGQVKNKSQHRFNQTVEQCHWFILGLFCRRFYLLTLYRIGSSVENKFERTQR